MTRFRLFTALPLLLLGCSGAPSTPQLVLLVTVDTLRADHLGAYGSDRGLSPSLDAFARESLRFTSAYTAAPFTLPAIVAVLTGRYPESVGVRSNASILPSDVPTLATTLRSHGWRTGAVVSNLILHSKSGLARGFDIYDEAMVKREAVRDWPERTAPDTTDAALRVFEELMGDGATKVFLWVHYQDPHGPYTPPPELREEQLTAELARDDAARVLPVQSGAAELGALPMYQFIEGRKDVAFYRAGYAAEVQYFDRELGRLFDRLGAQDDAVIVFTADHGESLGEGNFWFAHGEFLTEFLMRVPLLIRVPGFEPGTREEPVSLVDLWPTLLGQVLPSYTGADAGEAGAPGRDLLSPEASSTSSTPYFATLGGSRTPRVGVVFRDYKLVISHVDGQRREKLYRRGRSASDPATPLSAEPLAIELRETLARMRHLHAPDRDEVRQTLSEGDRLNLEALGYGFEP